MENFLRVLMMGIVSLAFVSVNAADALPSPYESVKTVTDSLLEKLVEIQPYYESDSERFFREIETSLGPFIDFKGFSRGVMAKYYRRASEQQKDRFVSVFQSSLIHTYATALVEFDNQQVVVKESNAPQKDPKKARVNLEVTGNDGTVYPVEYSLVLIDGDWKLRNLVINGINIGLQFRSQFSAYMQQHKNNIDKVIENWKVDG
ncbi:MAG: toluene tolerance protein [Gammaproteobacteria bacterium]|nr:toluene tolerance protein [Gammaproteobacteria bacterium]